jgi:NADH-quinone oxidoreductase subunit F
MDETTDMVKATRNLVRFFARESCGKCTPCREGTTWLERILDRIIDGHGRPEDIDLLLDVCDNISPGLLWPPKQTTICPLGQSATPSIVGTIKRFPEEYERYVNAPFSTTVAINGAAYLSPPVAAAASGGSAE